MSHKDWDLTRGKYREIAYVKLDRIPDELFGKVPLYMAFRVDASGPSEVVLSYELAGCDTYTPQERSWASTSD